MDFTNINDYKYQQSEYKREIDAFRKYFDPNVYFVDFFRNYIYVYYRYPGFDEKETHENSECLKIIVQNDDTTKNDKLVIYHLKYESPNICKISGSELLYNIYLVAKDLGTNIVIDSDSAYMPFVYKNNPHTKCSYNLSDYYILLKGISWYNQFGYYSTDHEYDMAENSIIRKQSISEYLNDNIPVIEKIINAINEMTNDSPHITFETPIKTVIKIIDKLKKIIEKQERIFCDNSLVEIIRYILKQHKLTYNDEELELDITNPETHKIYDKLSSKLTITTDTNTTQLRRGGKTKRNRQLKKRHYKRTKRT